MALIGQEFDETRGQKLTVTFDPEKAEWLFAGSEHSFAEIAAIARDRKQLPRFPLGVSIDARSKVEKTTLESANVVARLPGSDPNLNRAHDLMEVFYP